MGRKNPATVSQDGPALLVDSDTQHRSPRRMCVEPLPILSVYTRLDDHFTTPSPIIRLADNTTVVGLITKNQEGVPGLTKFFS